MLTNEMALSCTLLQNDVMKAVTEMTAKQEEIGETQKVHLELYVTCSGGC